jgi:hypothetical protein
MIARTMDAAFLNEVANHPEVRPWLGGEEGPLNLTPVVENPSNIALVTEGGGFVLVALMPGVYELHTLFLPTARGAPFFAAASEMFRFMFAETDCLEILTKCPDDNGPARIAAGRVGFRERFRRDDAWAPGVGVSYRVFSVDDFFIRDAECLKIGRWFHEELEGAKASAHITSFSHPDDETHDRAVGAAILMVRAGHPAKGIGFFNRWAIFAGYRQVQALGCGVYNIGDALIELRGESMRVVRWLEGVSG